MLKSFLFSLLLFVCLAADAQNLPDFESIPLKEKTDYAAANEAALKASNYLLSNPLDKNDPGRMKSARFLLAWMTGTPDYTFSLDENVSRMSKSNSDILLIYMAGMVKYCLENRDQSHDQKLIKLNGLKSLLAYCTDEKNGVKISGELKKMKQAADKGELEKYAGV